MNKNIRIKRWDIVYIKDKHIYHISDNNRKQDIKDYLQYEVAKMKLNDIRPCVVIRVIKSNITFIPLTSVSPKNEQQKDSNVRISTVVTNGVNSFLKVNIINTINISHVYKKSKVYLNKEDRKIIYDIIDNFFSNKE